MQTLKVSFGKVKNEDPEKLNELVNTLLGMWRMNGQILGTQFPTAQTVFGLEVYVNAPESDSLSEKYGNKYIKEALSKLRENGFAAPEITVLGKESDSAEFCGCKKITSFILFTTYVSLESPLRCFDCLGVVPLYKIPKTYDDQEYYNIICWQTDYQSCDSLQMNCAVGERFALNQLSKYDSQLTGQGLEVCRSIEKATGKKVFYYLYKGNAKSRAAELSRKCPSCRGDWYLKESLHNMFDFKCEKCKLLSNIAWSVRH